MPLVEPLQPAAPSTQWREIVPQDEAAQFAEYVRTINRYQQDFARRGDGQNHRGFHVKSHAGLRGTFRVLDDIPADARHGVFRTPRSFPAWVRLSNGFSAARPDWFPDLLGFSVRLEGVGDDAKATQDFLGLNQSYLPAEDAGQLMIMSISAANVFSAPFRLVQGLGLARALRVMLWSLRWAPHRLLLRSAVTEDFHGGSPIAIGPHAVKFKWQSRQPATARRSWRRHYLRDELQARLAESDLHYDFLVQFYADPVSTPIDGAYAWATDSLKLAELTIHRTDLTSPEAKQDEATVNSFAFNPWHALPEHRPIGNIQRGRRLIYQASARYSGREAG